MRNDYYKEALQIVGDPYVLINMIWGRTRMLWRGNRPLIGSFEELSPEDVALREIIDGAITHVSGDMVIQGNTIRLENIVTRSDTSTSPSVDASCNAAAPT
jgi:DNA-directed RNA polymerase subunit omega